MFYTKTILNFFQLCKIFFLRSTEKSENVRIIPLFPISKPTVLGSNSELCLVIRLERITGSSAPVPVVGEVEEAVEEAAEEVEEETLHQPIHQPIPDTR